MWCIMIFGQLVDKSIENPVVRHRWQKEPPDIVKIVARVQGTVGSQTTLCFVSKPRYKLQMCRQIKFSD